MAHKSKQTPVEAKRPRIVIVGAGFGGLWAAKALKQAEADVLLVDRNNYHTFLPLLYQVAAAEIEPSQIAYPVRGILRSLDNVSFVMADVQRVDPTAQIITTSEGEIWYDYLVLATGSVAAFFGIPGAADNCFTMKSVDGGVVLRNQILSQFEAASHETDADVRRRMLTFVVIGGGPSGVEYAGALAQLIKGPLTRDYRELDMREVRVVLVEAADNVLGMLPQKLGRYAIERLEQMGVDVRLESPVSAVRPDGVVFRDGTTIAAETAVWTAGVAGEAIGRRSDIATARNGTIPVEPTLRVPGFDNLYAIGDLAAFEQDGEILPMVAPVAMQQGDHVARNIQRQLAGEAPQPFTYSDKGSMAVIGRNAAVAEIGGRSFTGYFAWLIWLVIHILQLIGFRNRLFVILNWAWAYWRFEYMVRLIQPRYARARRALALEADADA